MVHTLWRSAPSVLLVSLGACCETSDDVAERLLSQYGSLRVRPGVAAAKSSNSTAFGIAADVVETQFVVDRFRNLNPADGTWGVDGHLLAWWSDATRLAFDGSGSCSRTLQLSGAQARIWKPGFYWEGAVKVEAPSKLGVAAALIVSPDGHVQWRQQVSLTLSCRFQLDDLPFDTQREAPVLEPVLPLNPHHPPMDHALAACAVPRRLPLRDRAVRRDWRGCGAALAARPRRPRRVAHTLHQRVPPIRSRAGRRAPYP